MKEKELIKQFEGYLKQRDQLIVMINQVDGVLNFIKSELDKLKGEPVHSDNLDENQDLTK